MMRNVGGVLICLPWAVNPSHHDLDRPTSLKSVTHGQSDADLRKNTVTSPAAGHHRRPLTGTKLYCLATEAHICPRLFPRSATAESRTRDLLSRKFLQRPNHDTTGLRQLA